MIAIRPRHLLYTAVLFYAGLLSRAAGADFQAILGDLPKTVSAEKGPYLVTSDIYVPAGKTVVVDAGAVFLFKNFTGLHVQGTLIAKGTAEKPVVFTSENDKRFNKETALIANPYDWNGIFIHNDAIGTDLQHVEVVYSVYGINALTRFFRIVAGTFRDNGRANLTIEGQAQAVTAEPYTYSLSVKNAAIDGVPVKILLDPDARRRNIVRYTGIGVLAAGVVAGAVFTTQWDASKKRMSTVAGDLFTYTSSDFTAAQSARNTNAALMTACYALGFIGACGFTYSFTF
ncbi:MAG TPA: hypothetical protein VLX68_14070 [Chitinivibrionales bacterium]|nr:hypothetical protein [Chitinivibrionales bacterium]